MLAQPATIGAGFFCQDLETKTLYRRDSAIRDGRSGADSRASPL